MTPYGVVLPFKGILPPKTRVVARLDRLESSGNWPLVRREWPARGNFVGNTIRDHKYEIPQAGCTWRAGWGHPKLPSVMVRLCATQWVVTMLRPFTQMAWT